MIKFGGARPTGKAKKSTKSYKKLFSKLTLKKKPNTISKNILEYIKKTDSKTRKLNTIKQISEQENNLETYMLKLSKKFIKLFEDIIKMDEKLDNLYYTYHAKGKNTNVLNNKSREYQQFREDIEDKLKELENKGNLLERHKSIIPTIHTSLKMKDNVIDSYMNVLKSARKMYNRENSKLRDEASIFLITVVDELLGVFFKKENHRMNVNENSIIQEIKVMEEHDTELDKMLNMFNTFKL